MLVSTDMAGLCLHPRHPWVEPSTPCSDSGHMPPHSAQTSHTHVCLCSQDSCHLLLSQGPRTVPKTSTGFNHLVMELLFQTSAGFRNKFNLGMLLGPIDFNVTIICLKLSMCLTALVNSSSLMLVLTRLTWPGAWEQNQGHSKRIKGVWNQMIPNSCFYLEVDSVT